MINIASQIGHYRNELDPMEVTLIAISKTKPNEDLIAAYEAGQRHFGENKVQELARKSEELPKDILWHMVGHLQRNKVKYIASFVHLIHSVDSLRLLKAINKEGEKSQRVISVLLQVHIASEETKFGFNEQELMSLLSSEHLDSIKHISIKGLMGMATNTENEDQVRKEFRSLKRLFDRIRAEIIHPAVSMETLSMGMSGDYPIAVEEGSNMVRIGSSIFGARNYVKQ